MPQTGSHCSLVHKAEDILENIISYCSATQSAASPIICQPQLKILGKSLIGLAWVRMSHLDELNLVRGQCQNKMAAATEAIYSFNKYFEHLLCTKALC